MRLRLGQMNFSSVIAKKCPDIIVTVVDKSEQRIQVTAYTYRKLLANVNVTNFV